MSIAILKYNIKTVVNSVKIMYEEKKKENARNRDKNMSTLLKVTAVAINRPYTNACIMCISI